MFILYLPPPPPIHMHLHFWGCNLIRPAESGYSAGKILCYLIQYIFIYMHLHFWGCNWNLPAESGYFASKIFILCRHNHIFSESWYSASRTWVVSKFGLSSLLSGDDLGNVSKKGGGWAVPSSALGVEALLAKWSYFLVRFNLPAENPNPANIFWIFCRQNMLLSTILYLYISLYTPALLGL